MNVRRNASICSRVRSSNRVVDRTFTSYIRLATSGMHFRTNGPCLPKFRNWLNAHTG